MKDIIIPGMAKDLKKEQAVEAVLSNHVDSERGELGRQS